MDPRWQPVAQLEEIEEDRAVYRRVSGREVLIFRVGSDVHAIDARCPHHGSRLGDGLVSGCLAVCPSHGWAFDIRTGRNRVLRASSTTVHPVLVRDGVVHMRVGLWEGLTRWWRSRGS